MGAVKKRLNRCYNWTLYENHTKKVRGVWRP